MARKLQIRRGAKSKLPTLSAGEFGLCTDTNELFIGGTSGNIPAGGAAITPAYIGAAASTHTHAASDIKSGTLAVARGGTGVTSLSALAEALGRYRFHCGCYPTAEDGGLEALSAKTSRYKGWLGPYAGAWGHMIPDPWKRPYIYEPQTNAHPVVLSLGPDGIRGTADDVVPADGLFDKPFSDTSWTNNWVHFSRRGIIVVPNKKK